MLQIFSKGGARVSDAYDTPKHVSKSRGGKFKKINDEAIRSSFEKVSKFHG